MNNFEYKNPTKILFGKGQIEKLSKEIPENSKTLILYGGGSIKKMGFTIKSKMHFQIMKS